MYKLFGFEHRYMYIIHQVLNGGATLTLEVLGEPFEHRYILFLLHCRSVARPEPVAILQLVRFLPHIGTKSTVAFTFCKAGYGLARGITLTQLASLNTHCNVCELKITCFVSVQSLLERVYGSVQRVHPEFLIYD